VWTGALVFDFARGVGMNRKRIDLWTRIAMKHGVPKHLRIWIAQEYVWEEIEINTVHSFIMMPYTADSISVTTHLLRELFVSIGILLAIFISTLWRRVG